LLRLNDGGESAVSSNLIALAFIGQMSLGTAFYAFALILLPVLAFVGVVTFRRLVQASIEDVAYARRIARLRDFYLEVAPELKPYVLLLRGPRTEATLHGERLGPSSWQLTLTTAGMVAVVNSVVIGACAGLLLETLRADSTSSRTNEATSRADEPVGLPAVDLRCRRAIRNPDRPRAAACCISPPARLPALQ
jgi:hypothetical protein